MNTKISSERTYRKVYKAVMEALEPVRNNHARLVHGSYSNQLGTTRPERHVGCLVGTLGFKANPEVPSEVGAKLTSSVYALPVRRLIEVGIDPVIAPYIVEALEAGFEDGYFAKTDKDTRYPSLKGLARYHNLGRRISLQYTPQYG